MIDRETQQRIKDAANIVEVVGDYVKLTRRGANYMGLCPFHNERTPSFSVSPQRNFCHCFSCKKGGSPVNFLMEKEGIGYTEALLMLAKKYNIPVRERELSDEERARMSEREAMFVANEWAMNLFHDNLYNTEEGRDIGLAYLYGRGITDEAIRKFKLGYSIDRGDALLSRARREGYDIDVLKKLGLVGTSQSGHDYDRFRGRVMFPIRNASGKPVAFGGRTLKGEAAKYINSPESVLYKKSNELYGIFEAKGEIIRNDRVFLMEGYLDVIGSWQAGLRNAVASSGTALTDSQIALLHRFTENVTLIYDGDSAGIKASLRGIDMLLAHKLHVRVLLLPDGEDPDSFAKKNTPEEFTRYIDENQSDFIGYKLSVLLGSANGNPQEVSAAVRSVVESIASVPDEIERISYIKEIARQVGIDESVIARQVGAAVLSKTAPSRSSSTYSSSSPSSDGSSPLSPSPSPSSTAEEPSGALSPYFHLEQVIIRYCVRYAFLRISPEGGDPTFVIDYIAEEMAADEIEFSTPSFRRVFDILLEARASFTDLFESFSRDMEGRLQASRDEFHDSLRLKGGSMALIRKEEERFQLEEEERRSAMVKKFSTNFSVDCLVNHEEKDVRDIANPLVAERHVLSSIYSRGAEVRLEEDRLDYLVPRALSELRSEILGRRYQEVQRRFVEAVDKGDGPLQKELMARLAKIAFLRKRIAENLGDRILSPR